MATSLSSSPTWDWADINDEYVGRRLEEIQALGFRHRCHLLAWPRLEGVILIEVSGPAGKSLEDQDAKIDLKSVVVPLSPLLIDFEALKKAHQKRKSPFVYRSIHVADLPDEEAKGWELAKKAGKRRATVQKRKPISRYLEDRFWSLCRSMGYPVMNGEAFKISFAREDGSTGSKQIDVFCKDEETVIIAECKTREVRGRKTLQKDLHETAYLQKAISNAVRNHFGEGFKPKILWLYVTENIIWSEPDVDRANVNNIRIITENELQYFEAYINHMGSAGRYQFLAEFLQGQEIQQLKNIKVPAVKGASARTRSIRLQSRLDICLN